MTRTARRQPKGNIGYVENICEYLYQHQEIIRCADSYSELLPFSKNVSNPATNSVFVSSTAFLMDPPVEEMYEKSNSSKSSTFDRKQFQKLQQRKRNTTEQSTEQNLLFYYNHSRIIGIWILHRLTRQGGHMNNMVIRRTPTAQPN